jgi:hypothetical protein
LKTNLFAEIISFSGIFSKKLLQLKNPYDIVTSEGNLGEKKGEPQHIRKTAKG